ncbi:pentatricopeptide repeat-containing protein At1g71460, chloroplastic [Impatiens glandulifera]|uniref:pentatricopeptide repeat-containing protein At1g71460, chloroplastic n=1 Tax=Impatiens glandulifera TaxID=253017 RepID=UPI001FB15A9F|nr:pentatricopeptide repeat-containing protein At1g71460, chloroplastic [Impatiens glandulifera]
MEPSISIPGRNSSIPPKFGARLHLHALPPNPLNIKQVNHPTKPSLPNTNKNNNHERNNQPPKTKRKFMESDSFPSSLPIHTKNPYMVYRDIQRFARQNKLKEAIAILDYLDKRGTPVNVTTFNSLIATCVRLKALTEGRQVHTHIRINGLEKNEFLCTKLVNMYHSCGAIEDARQVFDGMPSSNVHPWNALLRGSVVYGNRQSGEVVDTFSEMREIGIQSNVYTFSCLIKSFAGSLAASQGFKIHALLVKNGFLDSMILQTSLIDMYFKCRKINLACSLFEGFNTIEIDIVAWGTMIAGFAHNKLPKESLAYFRRMIREGISPNSVILTTIIPVLGELSARKLGQEVHAFSIKKNGYIEQLPIQSSLIDMYCKCGDLGSGRRVFHVSSERSVFSWTALLSGYAEHGRLEQALRTIVWMQKEGFKPDIVTIATILPVCSKLKALRQGKEIHAFALKNGILPGISITTCLMMMYSKCGFLDYSRKLFRGLDSKKNVIAWTAMIDSLIDNNCLEEAVSVFRSLHRHDAVAVSRILNVCGRLCQLRLGREIHGQVLKKRLELIPFVSSEMIRMYGSCGETEKARRFFDAILVKGPLTWTAIIEAYGQHEHVEEALDLFTEMTLDGYCPNRYTFEVVLRLCERAGLADEACRLFNLMVRKYQIKPCEEHYSSVIDVLNQSGRIEDANAYLKLKMAVGL